MREKEPTFCVVRLVLLVAGLMVLGAWAMARAQTEGAATGRSWAGTIPAPDFPPGLDWLNVERPLTWEDLKGKAVILDFWTYGCINCLHNLPGLLQLQQEFEDELVIIGVHSAKFPHEGETENIRRISARYGLAYPIVNDRDFFLFRLWGARAWPTIVLIDPDGKVVGGHSGEGVYPIFRPVLEALIAEFDAKGLVDRRLSPILVPASRPIQTTLSFPGKVWADPQRGRVFIADTHHHRVVVAQGDTGEIQEIIGSGRPGFVDGDFRTAQFQRPQGMALSEDGRILYVADSGNHALRRVLLDEERVETLTGSGRQARSYPPVGGKAPHVELSSPWDVVLEGDRLYVAMAGSHQLWWVDLSAGMVEPLAGSGREGTVDGPGILAELAQPMGLTLGDDHRLYFVDTEGSSVRFADISASGEVGTVAGSGASLFDFGDVDGVGADARFQHPRGITYADGFLYVADTYNGKIKRIDPRSREVTTILGAEHGWRDGTEPLFYEPGGIHAAGGKLYVADTNNHLVRIVDLATGETRSLVVWGSGRHTMAGEEAMGPDRVVRLHTREVTSGGGRIHLDVQFPPGYGLNALAPSTVAWADPTAKVTLAGDEAERTVTDPAFPLVWEVVFAPGTGMFAVDLDLLYCEPDKQGLCFLEQIRLEAPFEAKEVGAGAGGGEQNVLELHHTIPLPEGLPGSLEWVDR